MSRTLRPIPTLFRAGVAGAVAVVLLTACGGDSGNTATDSPQTSSAAGDNESAPTAAPDAADFCNQAATIDERVDTALSDLDDGDASLSDAFHQIAVELRGITAPAAITSDWDAMAAGLDRMADALGDVDVTDLGSLESLDEAEGDLTASSDSVDTYLSDECGI
ncbi:hypothetical protein [Modestobacter altitudinis]|uniref:hypothetical protein n=1 Tax=Modestobacter altitudinis TaxID=2213158 RepID=UPI00110CCDF1|nr:hypothetical protein [Modestobacter altitudinis]